MNIYICIHYLTCIYIYVHMSLSLCICIYVYVHTYINIHLLIYIYTHTYLYVYIYTYISYIYVHFMCISIVILHMGCLRFVGSSKLQFSFAKEPYKRNLYSAFFWTKGVLCNQYMCGVYLYTLDSELRYFQVSRKHVNTLFVW